MAAQSSRELIAGDIEIDACRLQCLTEMLVDALDQVPFDEPEKVAEAHDRLDCIAFTMGALAKAFKAHADVVAGRPS